MTDDPGTSKDPAAGGDTPAAPGPREPQPRPGVDPILGAVQSLAPLTDSVDTLLTSVDRLAETSNQMQVALDLRSTLDRAVGIVMGQAHCSAEAAFDMLAERSRTTGRDVADIAAETVAHAPDEPAVAPEGDAPGSGGEAPGRGQ